MCLQVCNIYSTLPVVTLLQFLAADFQAVLSSFEYIYFDLLKQKCFVMALLCQSSYDMHNM